MSPLRIALAHPYVWPGVQRGAERYLDDLARYLTGAGHDVDVITGGDATRTDVVNGVTLRQRRPRARRLGAAARFTEVDVFGVSAWPALARRRYDVVQALVPSAAIAARIAGQRTIFSSIGFPMPGQPSQRHRRQLVKLALRSAHVVTVPSEAAARAAEELTGRPAEPLWPGVWLDDFPLAPTPRAGALVLYPSDLSVRRKGLDVLVAAVARLLPRHPGLRLLLSGDGDPTWAFDRLTVSERQAVRDATEFGGLADTAELVRRYQSAAVTVLPAKEEAFGMVLIESMACGTPAVGCTGSGMTEVVTDRRTGRLSRFGDPDDLAAALDDAIGLAADPATAAACRRAAARFSWTDRIGPIHEDLYMRVARTPRRQDR